VPTRQPNRDDVVSSGENQANFGDNIAGGQRRKWRPHIFCRIFCWRPAAIPPLVSSFSFASRSRDESRARQGALAKSFFVIRRQRGLCDGGSDPILWTNSEFAGDSAHRQPTAMSGDKRNDDDQQIGVVVKTKPKTKKPSMYKVLLLNDDYTPMEFVVHVLERFFGKSNHEALDIMMHVHRRGVGVCGVYTYEVAETKVTQVIDFARRHQHPLQCTMEKE
jgi:ATP-dependent Clp protease adaptor protein ClpS